MALTEWCVLIRLARGQHVQQQHENELEAERQEQKREVEKLFCEVSELRIALRTGKKVMERNEVLIEHKKDGCGRWDVASCGDCNQVRAD